MKLWKSLSRRRQPPDSGTLERALAAPLPDGANAVPFESSLSLPPALFQLLHGFFIAGVLVWFERHSFGGGGSGAERGALLFGIALALLGAALGGGFNPARRLRISASGVTLERVFGSTEVPWYHIRRAQVAPDVSRLALHAPARLSVDLTSLDEPRRVEMIHALRARLPDHIAIDRLDEGWLNRRTAATVTSMLASLAMIGALVLAPRGGALGVRCSGPSVYLSTRFDVPRQPGCVFIRVSGATARSGIRRGDQMIALDGVRVTSGPQFNSLFDAHRGRSFRFTVVRAGTHAVEDITVSFGPSGSLDSPPDDAITHFLAAKSDLSEHPDIGLREYSKAIELAPAFDLAYVGRAEVKWEQRDYTGAAADFRTALALDPMLAEALRGLASLLSPRDGPASAESVNLASKALDADQCADHPEPNLDCAKDHALYASLAVNNGVGAAAREHANLALDFAPTLAMPHAVLARAALLYGDTDLAREELAIYRATAGAVADLGDAIEAEIALQAGTSVTSAGSR